MHLFRIFVVLMMAWPAPAGVKANLVGDWASANKTTLKVEANGHCALDQQAGTCSTVLGALFFQRTGGVVVTYGWKVKGNELTVSGGDLPQPMVFQRVEPGQAAASVSAAAAPAPVAAAPAASTTGPSAGRFSHPYWGVDFAIPPAWKAAEREGLVLLGSDTEAGLMIVRFVQSTNRQTLLQEYSQGFQEEGVKLTPSTRAEDFAAGSSPGVAGEMAGLATNGSRLQARVIGVLSPFGDAAIIMGLTTADKYAQLKPRVDALAASVAFSQPKIPPANIAIAGQYYYYFSSNSGSLYTRDDSLSICSNGKFFRKGEMYGSKTGQYSAVIDNNYLGSWAADGDGQTGTITLSYRDGRSERLRYKKSGLDIILNGQKYGRFGDGSCTQKSP
jgi:hypothetical protein